MATSYVCYPNLWKRDGIRVDSIEKIPTGFTCYNVLGDRGRFGETFSIPAQLRKEDTRVLCLIVAKDFGKGFVEKMRLFTGVEELQLQFNHGGIWDLHSGFFAHFLGLPRKNVTSLTLTSTFFQLPSREVLIFICSFPNLEYLRVGHRVDNINHKDVKAVETSQILDKRKLTGTLVYEGDKDFARRLSQPQTVFGFREIVQRRVPKSPSSGVKNLVNACSETVERIRINGFRKSSSDPCEIGPVSDQVLISATPLDLSNAQAPTQPLDEAYRARFISFYGLERWVVTPHERLASNICKQVSHRLIWTICSSFLTLKLD